MILPQPLTRIIEIASEKLPEAKKQEFYDTVTAAANGKDLSVIHWKFLAAELRVLPDHLPRHVHDVVELAFIGMVLLSAGKAWSNAAEVSKVADSIAQSSPYASVASVASYAAAAAVVQDNDSASASCIAHATGATAIAAADYSFYPDAAYAKTRQRQRGLLLSLIKSAPNCTS